MKWKVGSAWALRSIQFRSFSTLRSICFWVRPLKYMRRTDSESNVSRTSAGRRPPLAKVCREGHGDTGPCCVES